MRAMFAREVQVRDVIVVNEGLEVTVAGVNSVPDMAASRKVTIRTANKLEFTLDGKTVLGLVRRPQSEGQTAVHPEVDASAGFLGGGY